MISVLIFMVKLISLIPSVYYFVFLHLPCMSVCCPLCVCVPLSLSVWLCVRLFHRVNRLAQSSADTKAARTCAFSTVSFVSAIPRPSHLSFTRPFHEPHFPLLPAFHGRRTKLSFDLAEILEATCLARTFQ